MVASLLHFSMLHIVLTTDDSGYCLQDDLEDAPRDLCSSQSADFYYRMYAVVLGDFTLKDYRQSSATSIIFFFFTILGIIILLNVLIAGMRACLDSLTFDSIYQHHLTSLCCMYSPSD